MEKKMKFIAKNKKAIIAAMTILLVSAIFALTLPTVDKSNTTGGIWIVIFVTTVSVLFIDDDNACL